MTDDAEADAQPTSANSDRMCEPFPATAAPIVDWVHGARFAQRYRRLGAFGGGVRVGVDLVELAPGKTSVPAHYHLLEEEHLLVLDGAATLRLGDRSYPMKAGDYVCFPAGQAAGHAMINHGAAVCRYLMIGESDPRDVIVYPDAGRVSVRLTGEGYRKSAVMAYWEGEAED